MSFHVAINIQNLTAFFLHFITGINIPKGQFVVMKTGFYPMKVKLKLFFHWGIKFGKEYAVKENANRKVAYAEKRELMDEIVKKYHRDWLMEDDIPPNAMPVGEQSHVASELNVYRGRAGGKKGGSSLRITPKGTHGA